jgi:hypothetical protein
MGARPTAALARVDLPDPDSPTSPAVVPDGTASLTRSTTATSRTRPMLISLPQVGDGVGAAQPARDGVGGERPAPQQGPELGPSRQLSLRHLDPPSMR